MTLMGEVISRSPCSPHRPADPGIDGALARINEVLDADPSVVDNEAGAPLAPLSQEIRLQMSASRTPQSARRSTASTP